MQHYALSLVSYIKKIRVYIFNGAIQQVSHLGRGVDEESNKKRHTKEGAQSKKWCPSHKILLCTFFFNSIFIPSWFLIKLQKYYSEQKKEHIQKKTYQCIWNKHIIFAQKYYNPLLCQCGLFIHTWVSKISIASKDLVFYLLWYNAIRWSSHISKKSLLFSHSIVS